MKSELRRRRGPRLVSAVLAAAMSLTSLPVLGGASRIAAAAESPAPAATPASAVAAVARPRLLVKFSTSASDADRAYAVAIAGGAVTGTVTDLGIAIVTLDSSAETSDLQAITTSLANDPAVEWAEQDASLGLAGNPTDPYYNTDPITGLGEWGFKKILANQAWDLVRGSPSVTVAVIDTGIDATHAELAAVALRGATFVSSPSAACVAGTTRDDNTHGTHVAGIIAAQADNGVGIAGVSAGVKILPLKALDCTGTGTVSDIAQAIVFAASNGARVINVSLGSSTESPTIRSAVQTATSRGALVIAAAGNCGVGGGGCAVANEPSYPAAYPEVIAVAATDPNDQHASFSTAGAYVDISAPGTRIVSTSPTYATYLSSRGGGLGYAALSGTSQATPFVAAVAALLLSKEPGLTATQLAARLRASADDLGTAGADPIFGAGRVNAFRAVSGGAPVAPVTLTYGANYDLGATPRSVPFGVITPMPVRITNTSSFTWSAAGTNAVKLTTTWLQPTGAPLTTVAPSVTPLATDLTPGNNVVLSANVLAPVAPGVYQVRFDMRRENDTSFSAKGVSAPSLVVNVNSGYGASYTVGASTSSNLALGTPATLSVTVTNTGSRVWPAAGPTPVNLAYHWIHSDGTTAVWEGNRAKLTADVPAGGTVTLSLAVLPPSTIGAYTLKLDLVQEGLTWFSGQGVATRDLVYNVTSGLSPTWTVASPGLGVLPGGRTTVAVTVRNDGIATWAAGGLTPVRLSAHLYDVLGQTVIWDGPRTLLVQDVAPGQSFTGQLALGAPLAPGTYTVKADLVREGVTWFSTQGAAVGQTTLVVVADFRGTVTMSAAPTQVSRANPVAQVTVQNTSSVAWSSDGAVPVALAAHWYDAAGNVLVWDGPRTKLAATLNPGQAAQVSVNLGPPPPGAALLAIDLVADGLRWFGAGQARPVVLVP